MENRELHDTWVGLTVLINAAKRIDEMCFSCALPMEHVPTFLNEHPFGLTIPDPTDRHFLQTREIRFAGWPGYTEESVKLMSTHIAVMLASSPPTSLQYMRTIFIECDPDEPKNHHVYYEIGFQDRVYLCGGCTDCSGAGGAGKTQMDALFSLIGKLFGVNVDTETISLEEGCEMEKSLKEKIEAYRTVR